MTRRLLLTAALTWTVAYLALYLAVMRSQDSGPAPWYVAVLGLAIVLLCAGMAGTGGRILLVSVAVLLGLAALAGLLSIGLLLIPAALAVALAAADSRASSTART